MDTHINIGTNAVTRSHVRLSLSDRRRHLYASGATGSGKTTWLEYLFSQEVNSGRGVMVIDPHGDFAERCPDLVPKWRINKTIYLNPADLEWPIGFNILDGVDADDRDLRVNEIVAAIRSIWSDSWGPRLTHILRFTLLALIEVRGSSLLSIQRMLIDADYRAKIIEHITDPATRFFWEQEFVRFETNQNLTTEAISPVLNKIGALLASPALRNIIFQAESAFDPRHLIDNNYIIIVNLSKGRIGEANARLLGALLVSAFGAAAMSRADTPESARKDFCLIADEFQTYITESFATLLSEARKYRLSLVLAHQYLGQLTLEVRNAALGNAGTIMTFAPGPEDLDVFSKVHYPVRPDVLSELSVGEAWCKRYQRDSHLLYIPYNTLPQHGFGEKILRNSRHNWSTPRAKVEDRFSRFFGRADSARF
jgi:hypothetical protein